MDFDLDTEYNTTVSDFDASQWSTDLTSIYDHRAIIGLPDWATSDGYFDPLNSGNTAVDLMNAILLLGNGEISPADLQTANPLVFDGLLAMEIDDFVSIFGDSTNEETVGDRVCDGLETGGEGMVHFGTTVAGAAGMYILYTGGPTDPTDAGAAAVAAFGLVVTTVGGAASLANWIFCDP